MKIQPLKDRILVEPTEVELKTKGGLLLTENNVTRPMTGVAVAVGKDCEVIKEGDKVAYQKNAGTEMKVEGKDYFLMRSHEIYAIID